MKGRKEMKLYNKPEITLICFKSEDLMKDVVNASNTIANLTRNSNGIKYFEVDENGDIK